MVSSCGAPRTAKGDSPSILKREVEPGYSSAGSVAWPSCGSREPRGQAAS